MKKIKMKLKIIIFLIFTLSKLNPIFSQDFYINQESEVKYLNYVIPPHWLNLNQNESYYFLNNTGFIDIETISNGNEEIVTGRIANKEYIFLRSLVFKNKIIKEYSDQIMFIQPCIICLANDIKTRLKNNITMQGIIDENYQSAIKSDSKLKDILYKNHIQSLNNDGIKQQPIRVVSDFDFEYTNSFKTEDFNIIRNCSLELDKDKVYKFYSERRVILNEQDNLVGGYNLISQSNKHILFGIDLNSDWKSLTNLQALAYFIQNEDKNSKFVITDCNYILDKIDSKFLNIGFKELLLIFPKGYKGKLESLYPEMFIGKISYSDVKEYIGKANKDVEKILSILKYEYGEPEINIKKNKYSVFEFNGVYYQIIVTCREDELTTTFIYTKK